MSSVANQSNTIAFRDILGGDKAFYSQPDYVEVTQRDFAQKTVLPVSFVWNSEDKIFRIVKQILSIIVFPIGVYKLLHSLVGKVAVLPASSPSLMGYSLNHVNDSRKNILIDNAWKYKRITIEVDGYKIDAIIVGKESTLNNGRWLLAANGNGEFCEDRISNGYELKQILSEIKGNAIGFNYPGVGASSGFPNRYAMEKAYRAILNFLEDKKNGIGAKEIIGYGHSIGGGVQGGALKDHEVKNNIKYVFVKSRTFSDLSTVTSVLTTKLLGFLVKILGWNLDSVKSSKKLRVPEIIMQTANVDSYEELTDSSKIIDDGVIAAKASLAKALLNDPMCPRKNKLFLGIKERHNDELQDPSFLATKIEALLQT